MIQIRYTSLRIQYIFQNLDMFLFGGGNTGMQIKKKRNQHNHHQQGGWGGGQQGGWGGQQQQGGWGEQQQGGGGWGEQQQGGWGGQQQGGWGGQQQGGWGGQQQQGGWGGQQQQGWGEQQQGGGGWGEQQQQGGWGGQQGGQGGPWGGMGFIQNQSQWGNNYQGLEWIQEMKKRNDFNIVQPGQENNLDFNELISQQIVFLEPSPSQQKLQELKQNGEVFQDDRFPPNENSLSGEYGHQTNWSEIQWCKVTEAMEGAQIFTGKVEPGDIKQGYLGDCYFLAGLAALAERPDRIYNLFLLQELNDVKYFSVKMLFKGKWVTIDMDEYVPFLYGKPAFTKAKENELWVVLLEKAWAKLYTSYKRIEAGYPEEALHDLTGAPIKQLYFQHSSFDKERDWQYLVEASKLEYSMVSSSMPGSDTNKSYSGVVQGHAYTFLNATYLRVGGQTERIVQLRNPWGKGQFKGKWSDGDGSWDYVDEAEKQRVGYHPDGDDGIFFMSWDDYLSEFRALTIAEINDDASYVYKSFKDPENKGVYFTVEILQAGLYSFNIDKTPERIYPDQFQNKFHYPEAHLEMGRIEGGGCHRLQGFRSGRRTLFKKENLQPGTYVVMAKIDYNPQFENEFDVNLAVYAPTACNIRLATHDEAVIFTGDEGVEWVGEEVEEEKPWNSQGNAEFDANNHFGFKGAWDNSGGWGEQGGNGGNGGWGEQQGGGGNGWGSGW